MIKKAIRIIRQKTRKQTSYSEVVAADDKKVIAKKLQKAAAKANEDQRRLMSAVR